MEKKFAKTVWQLFEQTGQIGYYNLFTALGAEEVDDGGIEVNFKGRETVLVE
jgi:hypothetical protein